MTETEKRRRTICLDYLRMVARDMRNEQLAGVALFEKSRQRLLYIRLAAEYGCSFNEMRMALGISGRHLVELMKIEGVTL